MGEGTLSGTTTKARAEVAGRVRAIGVALAHPRLRRLELAWLGFNAAEYAVTVALGVYAFARGGAAAVGIVTLARTLPAIVSAPVFSVLTDRLSRRTVLSTSLAGRAVVSATIALLLFLEAPAPAVYALAALDVIVASSFYPAAAALIPDLSRTAGELSSANAVFSVMENVGSLVGPLVAALLIAASGVTSVFALSVAIYVAAVLATVTLVTDRTVQSLRGTRFFEELRGGLATLRAHRQASIVVGLWSFESLIVGAGEVFVVVIALDLLDWGDPGVGLVSAVMGLGGLFGAAAMAAFSRAKPYGRYLGIAIALLGAGLIGAAFPAATLGVIIAVIVIGIAQSQADVAAQTLLQRTVPEATLGRVLGAFEGLYWGSLGLGAVLASTATVVLGPTEALIAFGVVTAVVMLASLGPLSRIDSEAAIAEARIDSLIGCHLFSILPVPTVEYLATHSEERGFSPGDRVIHEGDVGDQFYVITAGTAEVTTEGRHVATLEQGDYFGEIALLLGVPRTATVEAATDLTVIAVDAPTFMAAVTSHATSSDEASSAAVARVTQTRRIRGGT